MNNRSATLALLISVSVCVAAIAQPPAIFRWTGSTASAQPFGFSEGSPLTLTWGFMSPGTLINDSPFSGFASGTNNLQTRLNTIYGNQGVWQPLFQSVFDRWSAVSGLTYVYEPNDDGASITFTVPGPVPVFPTGVLGTRADVRIGGKSLDGNSGVLAYNYFPNIGEMVIDTNDNFYNDLSSGSLRLRNVVAHEHGHGIGMDHLESNNSAQLMEPFIDLTFDGPQYHDILMAHRGYGDFNEKSSLTGNDVFATATNLGNLNNANSNVSIGNDARNLPVGSTEVDFVSIDDDSDTDFYRFHAGTAGAINILLESLGMTYGATSEGGTGATPFNTEQRSDLTLALLAGDGTTILQQANATGLGGDESFLYNLAGGGNYYVRITGLDNADSIVTDTQFYGLTLSFTAAAIPEPSTWAILCLITLGGLTIAHRRRRQRHI